MKKMFVRLLLVAVCMGSGVVFGADKEMTSAQRDECLLASKDCQNAAMSLQEKIKKLQTEISKGQKVYTADELKKLEQKIKEAETTLDLIMSGP